MDGYRGWEEDFDGALPAYEPAVEPPPGTALDDRRTYVRAFNRWVALLHGRRCPSIQDMETGSLEGPNSILLDLRDCAGDPAIRLVGSALKSECGAGRVTSLSEVPQDSLLFRLAGHYAVVLESSEPIAFEGEHVRADGTTLFYRGILLPYSSGSSGEVDLIHGMINWREAADSATAADIAFAAGRAFMAATAPAGPLWGGADPAPVTAMLAQGQTELPL